MHNLLAHSIADVIKRAQEKTQLGRFMLGIAGAPGAGKTTLARKLVAEINRCSASEIAIGLPMDGFHMRNSVLDQKNLRALKGIPDTFDAPGFVNKLKELRELPPRVVHCPEFDRALDEPTEGAISVQPSHRIIIVEGNYLLLQREPWTAVAALLDESWFLDVSEAIIKPRLLERHIQGGRSGVLAQEKIESTDLPNAKLVTETRVHASVVLQPAADGSYNVISAASP